MGGELRRAMISKCSNACFGGFMRNAQTREEGKIAYLVLWLMGAPVTLLLILWIVFGNNIFGAG